MAAHVIDGAVIGGAWFALSLATAYFSLWVGIASEDYRRFFGDWYGAVGFPVIAILYLVLAQAATGYTAGKRLLGIRVVNATGEVPGIKAAALRTLTLWVEWFGVIALWAMWRHPDHQRFGDRLARTYVVRTA